jgi:IS30 family transposase
VCAETIYQAIYQHRLGLTPGDVLRTRRRCRRARTGRTPRTDRVLGPNISKIADRPDTGNEPGHYEGDLIIGARNATAAITLVERSSGFVTALALADGYDAVNVANTLSDWIRATPSVLCRSVTWDRGREMANWEALVDAWGVDIWFADPHSPWQRPRNECANRQLRYWFPKSTSLALPQSDFDHACRVLNNQPRRQHHGRTAAEVHDAALTVR